MRKKIGIFLIVFSLLLALGSLIEFEEDMAFSIFTLFCVSLPLYILGQFLRTSKMEMKRKGKHWLAIYVFCVIILPLIFYTYEKYEDMKWNTISDGKLILYEASSGNLGQLSLGFLLVLLLLIPIRLFSPELKRKRLMSIIIIGIIFIYGGFQYMMWSDYRGVHAEQGLITQKWNGQKHIQSFNEMERIYVQPNLHIGKLSDPSDETQFMWKLIFTNKNGENIIYSYRGLSKNVLDSALQIKGIASKEQITFEVEQMSEKEREWFDFELMLQELEEEPFYHFFEVEDN
ncbi:hypothetical protein [Lederbergia lenta]|uniref:Uncharacterized protein n=1 Tax=Lederbergia lenta TaxID=1467 RepID=A0A2X4YYA6_LEDLE|nr:hypothetical protein [Lederbergia lenta]MCM3113169.1 hypothetical protein [Lederbergia lenta]MEC2326043.1 hypothetical protein [Lederbergia lenta]SQI53324.1 Uncharacterised protein [Lederbergia lenta]